MINDMLNKANASQLILNLAKSLVTCLVAYLIPYLAMVGYKLTNSKLDKGGRWIVGITASIVLLLTQFAYLATTLLQANISLNFANYKRNLIDLLFYRELLIGLGIGIVFILLEVLPFFDGSKQASVKKIETEADEIDGADVSNDDNKEEVGETSDVAGGIEGTSEEVDGMKEEDYVGADLIEEKDSDEADAIEEEDSAGVEVIEEKDSDKTDGIDE